MLKLLGWFVVTLMIASTADAATLHGLVVKGLKHSCPVHLVKGAVKGAVAVVKHL